MIHHPYIQELKKQIQDKNNHISSKRRRWVNNNPYYYKQITNALNYIVKEGESVLHVRCSTGDILNSLSCKLKVGVDDSEKQIKVAQETFPNCTFIYSDIEKIDINQTFDYVIISSLEDIVDIKAVLENIKKNTTRKTRIILLYYNFFWNPLVKLAEKTGLKVPQNLHNWISANDLHNFIKITGLTHVIDKKIILFPFNIPIFSYILNKGFSRLPFFRNFNLINISIARLNFKPENNQENKISIIIPCKNEAGNIEDAVLRIPSMGSHVEILFGDDKSTDGTAEKVNEMIKKYPHKDIKLYQGPGISKAENVWKGFDLAQGNILMILDADLTVLPEELPYFYDVLVNGYGEFINGSRLVYPMHNNAMRLFNIIGNKFFSIAFTYILNTSIKDTLCGTKVMWREDFERIKKLRNSWGIIDKWGDYELIFGASKLHLSIIDLPVHYYERVYGETKMKGRIKQGWTMLKMTWAALKKIKFN